MTMKRFFFLVILLGILAFLLSNFLPDQSSQQSPRSSSPTTKNASQAKDAPQVEIVVQNLEVPWDMVFLPDNSMLVTERKGTVRLITPDGKLQEKPVVTLTQVNQIGEGGLHGIALHPEFSQNNFLYLYYTYANDENNTLNRVSRFSYSNGSLQNEQIIVDAIPGASNHDGGRIRFGPDNYLYITTGDAQEPSLSQNRNSLAGKILRVTDSGEPAPGNPLNTRIYSYGHRNPQGIVWDDKGQLFATEHGRSGIQSGLDELNLIQAGENYGWPTIEGDESREGMVTPLLNSGAQTTWAPGGIAYTDGALYFTGLRGQSLYKATPRGDTVDLTTYLSGEYGRLRNVIVGPDGLLYVSTSNRDGRGIPQRDDDKILRIKPNKL